ncbi:hypothetical protein AUC70_03495 [Methyloceanibacter stevinii]|uniref:Bifunctional riboflavin kinase/FMN adenylyltransferase n=1 Tax=Methyloceanibacter stevinii TaxID=1774970 RepID=A0A1E3VMX7_9HYPH|nr:hypothetical protein AUC70_03495 [Methyloceanibacter stevinii]
MDIVRSWREAPPDQKGAVLAIGNFDGVHRGHQAVLGVAKAIAAAEGRKTGAVIFEPHPREFFAPGRPFFRLTPLPVKLELLEALGLDVAFVLPFDRPLADLSADAFATDILGEAFGARHVVVGYDFVYGKGRTGTVTHLAATGEAAGYGVDVVEPVQLEGRTVFASSAIREHLSKGRIREAAEQLGYWWRARGSVAHGAGRGQGLGFPTVNFKLLPGQDVCHGIYAMRVHHAGGRHDAAGYVGPRPTFAPASLRSRPSCSTSPATSTIRLSRWNSSTSFAPTRPSPTVRHWRRRWTRTAKPCGPCWRASRRRSHAAIPARGRSCHAGTGL